MFCSLCAISSPPIVSCQSTGQLPVVPPRQRSSSSHQRLGPGQGSRAANGAVRVPTRQWVILVLMERPVSPSGITPSNNSAVVPPVSAANCNRLSAVDEGARGSPRTAAMAPDRRPSSMAHKRSHSSTTLTMIRFAAVNPKLNNPGAYRSCPRRHHNTHRLRLQFDVHNKSRLGTPC